MSALPLSGPKFRAFDDDGDPLAGGKLYSYAAGTTTPLNTYTTYGGTIANTNPVILDANGEADVWTTPGLLYKFVLKDASDVVQWTVDNFPSGTGSGSSSTTDFAGAIDPGGRLSLVTGNPVPVTDVSGATTVFYGNYLHNKIPLHDGSAWALYNFVELSQALSDATKSPAAAADDSAYDMFVWNDAGTLRLSRGPAWASTASRGTGAGSTELFTLDGRLVNRYSISNGPAADRGLYVGSIVVNGSVHGVMDSLASRHVWNNYNRLKRPMRRIEPAASWTYSTDLFRQANASSANELNVFVGIAREPVYAEIQAGCAVLTPSLRAIPMVGIGIDSTTVNGATIFSNCDSPQVTDPVASGRAVYEGYLVNGYHAIRWLEKGTIIDAGAVVTWYGTYSTAPLAVLSGIWGHVFA